MKKLIAILMLAVTVTACSNNQTTTTETMGEPVDSTLSQDTVGGGSVDTTAAVALSSPITQVLLKFPV